MEDFSQSRGDDDLFDDEIVPFDSVTVQAQDLTIADTLKAPVNHTPRRGFGLRGRGRGDRSRGQNDLMNSRFAPRSAQAQTIKKPTQEPTSTDDEAGERKESAQNEVSTEAQSTVTESSAAQPTPSQPRTHPSTVPGMPARPPAVRGDRTLTGGVARTKLTEEELSAKLAAAKERSQTISAAHARAQADAASFEERERVAMEKRRKEAEVRRKMDEERERNRRRKMEGAGGREWDVEKREEDFNDRGRGAEYTRGVHGAVRYDRDNGRGRHTALDSENDDLSQYEWNEDRAKGRVGRGRGRGRGARGDARNSRAAATPANQPDISAETEFPTLPPASKAKDDMKNKVKRPEQKRLPSDTASPRSGTGTWAEQVEQSEDTKVT